jgi:hypothetical protein
LKLSLIIPAPQILGLIAKTWRIAYFSHKESKQYKNLRFKQLSKSLNIWRQWKYWKGVWLSLRHSYWVWSLRLDGEHILVTRNLSNTKIWDSSNFQNQHFLGFGCSSHNIIIHKVWRTFDQGMIFYRVETRVML